MRSMTQFFSPAVQRASRVIRGMMGASTDGVNVHKLHGPTFAARMFYTDDARLNAFQYEKYFPISPMSGQGTPPRFMLMSIGPPSDFEYNQLPVGVPSPAPNSLPNPLLTPEIAASYYSNE